VGDDADLASQSLDKEVLFELNGNAQELLDQIEAALRRINKGIYGTCEYCRCHIPKKRIQALPFARYCVNCQISNESNK
jgi:DnaK suppressor protein